MNIEKYVLTMELTARAEQFPQASGPQAGAKMGLEIQEVYWWWEVAGNL